jgi:hypothetical protein
MAFSPVAPGAFCPRRVARLKVGLLGFAQGFGGFVRALFGFVFCSFSFVFNNILALFCHF